MATIEAIYRAVKIINSDAQISITDNDLDSIIFENGTAPISKSDIEAKLTQAQNELDAEKQEQTDNKTSGKAKLKSGETLNDAELKALFGD